MKSENLSFTLKWMELENIILSEVSQAQKTSLHVFSDMWNTNPIQIQPIFKKKTDYIEGKSHTRKGG
jgi:hypothetical protein